MAVESEFGGSGVQKNGTYPKPHLLNAREMLTLPYRVYVTDQGLIGDEEPDNGEAFKGLLPADVVRSQREASGIFEVGQIWQELKDQAE